MILNCLVSLDKQAPNKKGGWCPRPLVLTQMERGCPEVLLVNEQILWKRLYVHCGRRQQLASLRRLGGFSGRSRRGLRRLRDKVPTKHEKNENQYLRFKNLCNFLPFLRPTHSQITKLHPRSPRQLKTQRNLVCLVPRSQRISGGWDGIPSSIGMLNGSR